MLSHYKCRNAAYPRTNGNVVRQTVPEENVPWKVEWDDYKPPYFTSKHILNQEWADPEIDTSSFKPKWNEVDGNVNRKSFQLQYEVQGGYPLNPAGRTGLRGRGVLGRWGPNHAADPIITRWKRVNSEVVKDNNTAKPVLQFVAIKRRDCNEWAIPGGMVDPGEVVTATLKREFLEEAMNSLEMSPNEKLNIESHIDMFFKSGESIYTGYVDDIRNTDNAWIETSAYNFHDEDGKFVGSLNLSAGDDAVDVCWLDLSESLALYASHSKLVKLVVDKHCANW